MSQRSEISQTITDEFGEYRGEVRVVYYFDKITCPACKGLRFLLHDNREDVDSPQSGATAGDDVCYLCKGDGEIHKIDYESMTPNQIEIYKNYLSCMEQNNEILANI